MRIAFIRQKDEQKRNGSQTQKNITTTAPYDDGYLWRKYGEKKIRGNAFPRSYYRCTYKEDKGCQATKQVQQQCRSDPPSFLVTRKGEHTCNTAPTAPGHGYMVQCHSQLNRELPHLQSTSSNLLPVLSVLDHCGDCTLFHPEFSYSSRPTTNRFFYDYQPCSSSGTEKQYENHSVLDNSAAVSTPDAYAASVVSDSNFSDDSFHENYFSSSDMNKLEEFDFDEFCEFVLW